MPVTALAQFIDGCWLSGLAARAKLLLTDGLIIMTYSNAPTENALRSIAVRLYGIYDADSDPRVRGCVATLIKGADPHPGTAELPEPSAPPPYPPPTQRPVLDRPRPRLPPVGQTPTVLPSAAARRTSRPRRRPIPAAGAPHGRGPAPRRPPPHVDRSARIRPLDRLPTRRSKRQFTLVPVTPRGLGRLRTWQRSVRLTLWCEPPGAWPAPGYHGAGRWGAATS